MSAAEKVDPRRIGPTFAFVDPAELYRERPEPAPLLGAFLREGSVGIVGAFAGTGKSWLAVDAATSTATSAPWLARFATSTGDVALLDYENGTYELGRRLRLNAIGRGIEIPVPRVRAAIMPTIKMTSPAFEKALYPVAESARLIVIDTLRAASTGIEENSSEMRDGIDACRRVADRTGCGIILLAHTKKIGPHRIDLREVFRGSSAIVDAVDAALAVVSQGKGKPILCSQTKARCGVPIETFAVSIEDHNGGVVVTADCPERLALDDASEAEAGAWSDLCDAAALAVRNNPGRSANFLLGAARELGRSCHKTKWSEALTYLEEKRVIVNNGTPRAPKWFPA